MRRRWIVAGLAMLAAILIGAAGYGWFHFGYPLGQGAVKIGGPFQLVDQDGRTVTDRDFSGRPTAIYFGFTYCPDLCPTTLAALTGWLKALGPDADRLNLAFVTIDPERDTPKQLKAYLSSFDHRIRGLTGSPAQVAQIAREFHVYVAKVPLPGGGYTMDHSSAIYLMDAKGRFRGVITYEASATQALEELRVLVRPS